MYRIHREPLKSNNPSNNKPLYQRRYGWLSKHMKRSSVLLTAREMQIKTTYP
jgi:hypothetical protein